MPKGPSAIQERNDVGLLYTKKINIIFFGLASGTAEEKRKISFGHSQIYKKALLNSGTYLPISFKIKF